MNQFTNPFNGQTGMMPYDSRQGSSQGQSQRPPQSTGQQGPQMPANWAPYTPEPQPQFVPVQGRWVDNPTEVMPKEVPMDGNLYFFPQSDYQCIYAKVWTQDGRLMTYRFLPEKNEPPKIAQSDSSELIQQTLNAFGNAIDQRLADFEGRMNDILAPFRQTETAQAPKAKGKKNEEV